METPKRAWLLAGLSILTGVVLLVFLFDQNVDEEEELAVSDPQSVEHESTADLGIGVTMDGLDAWCDIDLAASVQIEPGLILIQDGGLGLVTLGGGGQVDLGGTTLELDSESQKAVEALDNELRRVVPEMVDIAWDGLDLARSTVDDVFATLADQEVPEPLRAAIDDLERRLQERFEMRDGQVRIDANGLAAVEGIMQDVEPRLEEALASSLETVLTTTGQAFVDDEISFKEGMNLFGDRLKRFGRAMEEGLAVESEVLQKRGEALCEDLRSIERLQAEIGTDVPALDGLMIVR